MINNYNNHTNHKHHVGVIITGFILGTIYYLNMSTSIPKDVNCSFVANIYTDIFAFIIGGILIYYGIFIYNDYILTIIGTAIITEHIWQFFYNKL